ncbi:alpha/beta fold hydrolase [Novosphingobium sp. JCM 18896]|uniref:alpha/beta fold hydrolase n=1 Tax=Novosphingobium sp. JCM 18896 TaxID=2989731 RepID=UPI002222B439|nr:alpha/beta hydrolase [Novosphingobium sp. JCM 18896]MCW1430638.1 alpha/beta hydrolase [Novosphingobium sp. JCM 18896]
MTRLSLRLVIGALLGAATVSQAQAAPPVRNVVLVHGAFADGSGWNAVAQILERDGYRVTIVQQPETSLEEDIAATNRVLDMQDGPTVLVGHSYGGVIITEAGNNAHVSALVYVAAFQPDSGESLASLGESMPPASTAVTPTADGFLFIAPAAFRADFAADLSADVAARMSRSQVPLSIRAASAKVTTPAWKRRPSYAVIATQDRSLNPDLQRQMYKRSGTIATEVAASHAVYISQPAAVAAVIEKAATRGE